MDLFKKKCTSKYYGVSVAKNGKFISHIQINNKVICLGVFISEYDGAIAYDKAVKLHGLDRRLNFPNPEPDNPIPNTKLIRLTQGMFAIVDEDDFERVSQYKWAVEKGKATYYASRGITLNGKNTSQKMHSFIIGCSDGQIDHINGNGLHNYKSNLRKCSHNQNMMNKKSYRNSSSKFKGVVFRPKNNNYQARISLNKKSIHIGCFTNEIDAAKAYNSKAKELFGEFAKLNIIPN